MLDKMLSISIIVPVYNVETYIHQCLDSILVQTFKDFELILVDDGSLDSCPDICDQYKIKDSRIRVIHKKNGGLMSAWKAGFEISRGQYIGFVDSDDWIEPQMYEEMFTAIESNVADIVQCDIIRELPKPVIGYCRIDKNYVFDEVGIKKALLPSMLNYWEADGLIFANSRCNKLIKRELIAENIKYCNNNISYGEDLNIMLPLILDCKKIACVPYSYYHYRANPESLTRVPYKKKYWQHALMLIERIKYIAGLKKINIDYLCYKLFNYMAIQAIENEINSPYSLREKVISIKIICQNPDQKFITKLKFKKLSKKTKLIYIFYRMNIYRILAFFCGIKK